MNDDFLYYITNQIKAMTSYTLQVDTKTGALLSSEVNTELNCLIFTEYK